MSVTFKGTSAISICLLPASSSVRVRFVVVNAVESKDVVISSFKFSGSCDPSFFSTATLYENGRPGLKKSGVLNLILYKTGLSSSCV